MNNDLEQQYLEKIEYILSVEKSEIKPIERVSFEKLFDGVKNNLSPIEDVKKYGNIEDRVKNVLKHRIYFRVVDLAVNFTGQIAYILKEDSETIFECDLENTLVNEGKSKKCQADTRNLRRR